MRVAQGSGSRPESYGRELRAPGPGLRGQARGAVSPAGRGQRPERAGCSLLRAMQARVGARESFLTPTRTPHGSVWSTETKAWGKSAPPDRRDLRARDSGKAALAEARSRCPRGYPRRGSSEPGAHSPRLANPIARTDAWRRGVRGPATRILTRSDGVMRHRQLALGPPGAQGVLTQVSAAPTAPLPCRPRGRGMRCMSAALDLLPGPVPLAFVARQES